MSVQKSLKKAVKKVAKSKDELLADFKHVQKVAQIKEIVTKIYPALVEVDSIYDAQTVANALSGFIEAHMQKKLNEIKLSEIEIDLSKEEESKIKTAILAIIELTKDESANELSETLERLGKALSQYSAHTFMKQPTSAISLKDILA